jgi:L-ascorbate metabolism protein UlaG (beta-lactamase superfamily)/cellulose biosynthesis protein BcsQ
MNLISLGHASYIFETSNLRILSDPVFFDPFDAGSNTSWPARQIILKSLPAIDVILISHSHFDHFDIKTLSKFSIEIPVVVPASDVKLINGLGLIGFKKIVELSPGEKITIGNTNIYASPSLVDFPEIGYVVQDETATIWNPVDSILNYEIIIELLNIVKVIDCALWAHTPIIQNSINYWRKTKKFSEEEYEKILLTAELLKAKTIIPSAVGFEYTLGIWQNHIGFPISADRFKSDIESRTISKVLLNNPGTIFKVLDGKTVKLSENIDYVRRESLCSLPRKSLVVDSVYPDLIDTNPHDHDLDYISKNASDYLVGLFKSKNLNEEMFKNIFDTVSTFGSWEVNIVYPCEANNETVYIEITDGMCKVLYKSYKAVKLRTYIAASAIFDIVNCKTSLYAILSTDRIRTICNSTEEQFYNKNKIDPLLNAFDKIYDIDSAYITNECKRWVTN